MKEILKYARANVTIKDEAGKVLFEDHNLFVTAGRAFIADVLRGAVALNSALFVCDLGDNSQVPTVNDIDLVSPITHSSPPTSYSVAGTITALSGEPTGLNFSFSFTPASQIIIKELGLFYRPSSNNPPYRGNPATTITIGTLIARLRTTLSSITVGATKTITIDWRIIF